MLLGFKTEIKVKSHQRILLAKHAGIARHAWNWGLDLTKQILDNNQKNPDKKIKFPTAIDLHKWLVALVKPENKWYYEVSKCAPQYALRHLRKAWDDCFSKKKKTPRFKRKGKQDSFTLDGSITVEHDQIKVPRIRWLKTYERLPQGIKPKSITISKKAQLSLSMRIYDCENCDWIPDRDYSASLNLLGLVRPDVIPVETKTPKSVDETGTEVDSIGICG